MEDFYMNITSEDNGYDYRNTFYNYDYSSIPSTSVNDDYDQIYDRNTIHNDYYEYYDYFYYIRYVVTCIIISIGLPLTLVAIYALYSEVRKDHVAPIYVINLLISDIIQFCCMIIQVASGDNITISNITYLSALMVSVCFMVCIALERYLVVAHPLWYRFRRTIKTSVVVCVLVWVLPFVCVFVFVFRQDDKLLLNIFCIVLLLPLPLFIFSLGGTLKALSASRVPSDEKRRIMGILVLVLLIYALLFLPGTILLLSKGKLKGISLYSLSLIFLQLSPLSDLTLYVFMRKGIIDKFLSSVCCCRMDSDDTNSPSV